MTSASRATDDSFCHEYGDYVCSIARQIHKSLPASVEFDDLVQEGFLGLLDARSKWTTAGGASFKGYAWFRIRGAIVDSLRRSKQAKECGRELVRQERVDDVVEHGLMHAYRFWYGGGRHSQAHPRCVGRAGNPRGAGLDCRQVRSRTFRRASPRNKSGALCRHSRKT